MRNTPHTAVRAVIACAAATVALASNASAAPSIGYINSTFNVPHYANDMASGTDWSVIASANGGAALDTDHLFGFDYNAGGAWSVFSGANSIPAGRIPAAPSGTDSRGLIMRAQDVDDPGTDLTQGIAARLNAAVSPTTPYAVRFDMWINYVSGSGSSEFAFYGLGANSTQTSIGTLTSGVTGTGAPLPGNPGSTATAGVGPMTSGRTFTLTGDGGFARDIRAYSGTAEDIFDTNYVAKYGTDVNGNMTTVPMDNGHPYYGANSVFPAGPSPTVSGIPGNRWVDVVLYYDGTELTYYLNGVPVYSLPSTSLSIGQAFLGYMDINSSVSLPAIQTFVVYDNFRILVPEPATLGLVAAGAVIALRRRAK
jgi:hypothetical protein